MRRDGVLAAYEEQIRRHPQPGSADDRVEHDERVTRLMSGKDGWAGVTWSDLDQDTADVVISGQISRFAELGHDWEWKIYSYDTPPDLPDRLLAAGFERQPTESLLVAELDALDLDSPPPPRVALLQVVDEVGVNAIVVVHDAVFGGDHSGVGRALRASLGQHPASTAAVVAWAGAIPVSAGRVEFHHGTDFASLWGGGTLPEWRGRGVFRALVSHRARTALSLGFRYLQVDASADSKPILQRLGFVELATTTPFTHSGLP